MDPWTEIQRKICGLSIDNIDDPCNIHGLSMDYPWIINGLSIVNALLIH